MAASTNIAIENMIQLCEMPAEEDQIVVVLRGHPLRQRVDVTIAHGGRGQEPVRGPP